jgi:hypothetical protein
MPAPPTEDGDQREDQDLSADPELREAEVEFLSEARLDQEQAERDAAALAMRTRELADVAFELMSRGDLVSVAVGDRSFTGKVIYAAGDLMTVQTAEPTVDFNLAAAVLISVTERAREGGVAPGEGPGSFRGRLMEWERAPEPVELGLADPARQVLKGDVRAAAEDHVVFVDTSGREWFVPSTSVAYLARWPRG